MSSSSSIPADSSDATAARPLDERVMEVLDLMRPAIQSDGGDLELVEVSHSGVVLVRFHGACVGCPSSNLTLQSGIERRLKERIPEVTAVRSVS